MQHGQLVVRLQELHGQIVNRLQELHAAGKFVVRLQWLHAAGTTCSQVAWAAWTICSQVPGAECCRTTCLVRLQKLHTAGTTCCQVAGASCSIDNLLSGQKNSLLQALAPSWGRGIEMICINIEFRGFCCRLLNSSASEEQVPKQLKQVSIVSKFTILKCTSHNW